MTIHIRRVNGSTFEVINGHRRLKAQLEVFGKATVLDVETGDSIDVHEVEGEIVALDYENRAIAETVATAALERAAKH